jgi:hypothetical protein
MIATTNYRIAYQLRDAYIICRYFWNVVSTER